LQSCKHGLRSPKIRHLVVMRQLAGPPDQLLTRRHDYLLSLPKTAAGFRNTRNPAAPYLLLYHVSFYHAAGKPFPAGCSKRSRCKAVVPQFRTSNFEFRICQYVGLFQQPTTSPRRHPRVGPGP
jgi:hypothetical protein